MKCYILLPCYNEEANITKLLSRLHTILNPLVNEPTVNVQIYGLDEYQVVALDNGSTDQTFDWMKLAQSQVPLKILVHKHNRGLADSYRTLLNAVQKIADPDDAVILMDADGTHDPYYIVAMLSLLKNEQDVIVASRYLGQEQGVPFHRRILSKAINFLIRKLCQVKVKDCTCGYRCYRASLIPKILPLEADGFEVSAEALIKASRVTTKITEIPFNLRYDLKQSTSKLNLPDTIRQYFKLLWKYTRIDLTPTFTKIAYRIHPSLAEVYLKDPRFWNDGMIALAFLLVSFFIYDATTWFLPWYLKLLGYVGIAFVSFCIQHALRRFWIFNR